MTILSLLRKITPKFLLNFYHYAVAFVGAVFFGFPSKKLIVIGVTGTSGKSTTVDFVTRILEGADNKVASTSSVRFKIGGKEWENKLKMTMPGRFMMQKFLRQAVKEGCEYAVLEVTSEGIKQFRHKFINFDSVVFLNLTPEHIESHGSFEKYRLAKMELFKETKNVHIINADDENASYFADLPANKKILYSVKNKSNIKADNLTLNKDGFEFTVNGTIINMHLVGGFNVYNALAAMAVCLNYDVSLEKCKKALEKIKGMPGRLEVVAKEPFWVVVDYAFTPDQLEACYKSLNHRPLVCVLGATGGGRDKWKRPVLGKIAAQYCKEIIITNEDPYDEDPWEIMEQVASGVQNQRPNTYHLILDRKEAIKKAIKLAKPTDTVIVTGKGSEPLMVIANGKKIPWDDRQIAREEIELN